MKPEAGDVNPWFNVGYYLLSIGVLALVGALWGRQGSE